MSISPLFPLAGAAAVLPLVGKAVNAVSEGLSFLDVLNLGGREEESEATSESTPSELDQLLSLGGGQGLNLQDMKAAAQSALQNFQQKLLQKLNEQGIDLSQPLKLQSDSLGNVYADHPQRTAIEQIFADDPELANEFHALAASFSLLQAAEQHQEIVAQLTGNSELDEELLSRQRDALGEFGLLINSEEAEVFFE